MRAEVVVCLHDPGKFPEPLCRKRQWLQISWYLGSLAEPATLGSDLEKIKKPDFINPVPFPGERVWVNLVFPVLGVIDTGSRHHQGKSQSGSWKENPLVILANMYILLWLPSELSS